MLIQCSKVSTRSARIHLGSKSPGCTEAGVPSGIHDVVSMTYGFKRRCHCVVEEECYC